MAAGSLRTARHGCAPACQTPVSRARRPRSPTRQGVTMPIATPDVYAEMLDRAKREGFAYPAINVSSSQTLVLPRAAWRKKAAEVMIRPHVVTVRIRRRSKWSASEPP